MLQCCCRTWNWKSQLNCLTKSGCLSNVKSRDETLTSRFPWETNCSSSQSKIYFPIPERIFLYTWGLTYNVLNCFDPFSILFLQECLFNKLSDKTGLRVFWNGDLRIHNCHDCCRRWYFTFNGAECSAPEAIDGVVYMRHGDGGKKNLHRVRQIEGVCEKVAKGNVRVGFWVGNCVGYGSADAWTGWNSVSRIYVEEVPPPQA